MIPALMSERSGLVGGEGRRSLGQMRVSKRQCHYPSPISRQNSPRGWGLTYTVEFSLQEDGAGKIQPKFKAGIALKRVMHS